MLDQKSATIGLKRWRGWQALLSWAGGKCR